MMNLRTDGERPRAVAKAGSGTMEKLGGWEKGCVVFLLCIATAIASPAQTLTTIHTFENTDGNLPEVMIEASNGSLYGLTGEGGTDLTLCGGFGCGTIFKITPGGMFTSLVSLDGTDGSAPYGPMVQAANGELYGALQGGGSDLTLCGGFGCGTVFKITLAGTLTTLYNFCSQSNCADGSSPLSGLVQAANGDFYGTTFAGGANCVANGGCGTVFKITPSGTLTTLYSFCSQTNCTDGSYPLNGLVQATKGNFYGTTYAGGASCIADGGCGTVFKITAGGTLTTLHSFDGADGSEPRRLIQASNADFYGDTILGGGSSSCTNGCGTIFRITPTGTFAALHRFNDTDGGNPLLGLQATDGNFYGTTHVGGAYNNGTIFKITPGGRLSTLYNFCALTGCPDGSSPVGLIQDTSGMFYGSTELGGTSTACTGGCGTIFSLSTGLKPFVETQPTSGKVGADVRILGTNLTGATSVTFNGTTATIISNSSSEIKTSVPTGATTGTVKVTTLSGMLKSNVEFRVTP
jgi:uncharacterized repeat protein (TIGR03803 family)